MSKVQAIILAGGQGSRLRPFTKVLPKPLVPLGEYSIAELIVRQLKFYQLKNIVVATGYLADLIESYFGDGHRWGVNIRYVREKRPLGTAGVIRLVDRLEDNVLVINGDTFTSMDFKKLIAFHKQKKGIATISVKERIVKTDFGVVEYDKNNVLMGYTEKPEHKSSVSMGVNILSKKCQKYIKKNESIGMPDLMLRMKDAGQKVNCYKSKDIWLDLGRLNDFDIAEDVLKKNRKKFPFIPSL